MTLTIKQAVVFAILMQGDEGIIAKSPKYIMEKLRFVTDNEEPEGCLDLINLSKFNRYMQQWATHL